MFVGSVTLTIRRASLYAPVHHDSAPWLVTTAFDQDVDIGRLSGDDVGHRAAGAACSAT